MKVYLSTPEFTTDYLVDFIPRKGDIVINNRKTYIVSSVILNLDEGRTIINLLKKN